jgi:hypothetical protein
MTGNYSGPLFAGAKTHIAVPSGDTRKYEGSGWQMVKEGISKLFQPHEKKRHVNHVTKTLHLRKCIWNVIKCRMIMTSSTIIKSIFTCQDVKHSFLRYWSISELMSSSCIKCLVRPHKPLECYEPPRFVFHSYQSRGRQARSRGIWRLNIEAVIILWVGIPRCFRSDILINTNWLFHIDPWLSVQNHLIWQAGQPYHDKTIWSKCYKS